MSSTNFSVQKNLSKEIVIPLVFWVSAFVIFSTPVFFNNGRFFNTDQRVFIRTAEMFRTRFSVVEPSPLNEKFQTTIIDYWENPYVRKHQGLISQYPPGQAIFLALLRTLLPMSYNFIACLIGACGVCCFYFLVKRLLGKREAIFCTATLVFTPIYFFWSMFALADVTAFLFILLIILIYLKARETNKVSFYVICSLCLGITVWLKYVNILLIIPVFFHYLVTRKKGEKFFPVLAGILVFCVCILLLLVYHKWAFGEYLTLGYGYKEFNWSEQAGGGSFITKLGRRLLNVSTIKQTLIKITNFPIHIAICSPLTLLGIFGCFSLKRKEWKILSLPILISLTLLFFYMISSGDVFGSDHYHRSLSSSYNRYILPVYGLLLIPASIFFRNLSVSKFVMALGVVTVINLSSLVAPINVSNLHWEFVSQKETYQLRQRQIELTSEGSIIIGQYVVYYMDTIDNDRHFIDYRAERMRSTIYRNELTRIIHALLAEEYDLYIVQDYEEEITIEGTLLELVDEETHLYKLKRI